jgi:hypothetical protein
LKEEVFKDEVTKVNEEERSSEEEVISMPLSLLPLHHLFTILPPSSLSLSLYSFLPALFLIPVSFKCGRKRVSTMMIVITKASMDME